jgi:hypothetical protein
MTSGQEEQYCRFLERLFRERANVETDEERARYQRDERLKNETFLAGLIGEDRIGKYRDLRDEREAATLESVSSEKLYEFARRIDLSEEQKQRLFEKFAEAARSDLTRGHKMSFQVMFGYGTGSRPRIEETPGILEGVLRPDQLELWQRYGQRDADIPRKALGLMAPMLFQNPDLLKSLQ